MNNQNISWGKTSLSNISEIILSNVDKKTLADESAVQLCNYMDVFYNSYITSSLAFMKATANEREIQKLALRINDIIITKDSETAVDIAKCAVVVEELNNVLCGYHLAILRPNKLIVDARFLREMLSSARIHHQFIVCANGITRFGLTLPSIRRISIPLPPLPEQRKIAAILSTWDTAIERTEQLIASLQKRKKGLMQRLLTGEVRFPEFTDEWREVKLVEIVSTFISGGTPSTRVKKYWSGNIPWVSSSDFGEIRLKQIHRFITNDAVKNSATHIVEKDSILVVTRVGVGKIAIAPCDITFSQDTTALLINADQVDRDFLLFSLSLNIPKLLRFNQGTSINGITRKDLKKIPIRIPCITEQKRIADVLLTNESEMDLHNRKLRSLIVQKRGLMQRLLTGQIRVNTAN